jgi:hypothetical protein
MDLLIVATRQLRGNGSGSRYVRQDPFYMLLEKRTAEA